MESPTESITVVDRVRVALSGSLGALLSKCLLSFLFVCLSSQPRPVVLSN